jgi:hypothetical protein
MASRTYKATRKNLRKDLRAKLADIANKNAKDISRSHTVEL